MNLGFGQGHRHAEYTPPLIRADADGREHGDVAYDPAMAHLFVARVEDEILDLVEWPVAPGRQLLIQQLGGVADPGSSPGQALRR